MDDDRRPDWARSSPLVVALGVVIERHGFDLALRGQMRLLHHARDRGWDSVWGAQHFLPTMAMTQPVPFLARLAAEAGEMRVGLAILLLALANLILQCVPDGTRLPDDRAR